MDNPFLQPDFSTEKGLKSGMDDDGAMSDVRTKPLEENPFMQGKGGTNSFKNPFLKKEEPVDMAPYQEMAEFGARHAMEISNTAVQKPPEPPSFLDKWRDTAKTTTGLMGETSNMVGSVLPMGASYAVYAIDRMRGKSDKEASSAANSVRENYSPSVGFTKLAELANIDPNWVQNPKFQELFQEFDENVIKPSRERYTTPGTFGEMAWNDIANLAVFAGAVKGTGMVNARYGKITGEGKLGPPADIEALKQRAAEKAAPIPTLPEQPPTAPPEGGLPPISPEFQSDVPALNPGGPTDTGPLPARPGTPPADVLSDMDLRAGLAKAGMTEAEIDRTLRTLRGRTGTEKGVTSPGDASNPTGLPFINEYPQPHMDQLGPDVDTTGRMHNPFLRNVVDLENAQKAPDIGAHSEMRETVEPQDPIRGPQGTLSFDEGIPQDIENKRFAPNLGEEPGAQNRKSGQFRFIDETGEHNYDITPNSYIPREARIWENPQALERLNKVTNLREALEFVKEMAPADKDRALAERLLGNKALDHDSLPIFFSKNMDVGNGQYARGLHHTSSAGVSTMFLDPRYASYETILHEAVHHYTNDALYAHENGKGTPEMRAYGKEVQRLYNIAKDFVSKDGELPDFWKKQFKNLREFNAYGLTQSDFQHMLASIPEKNVLGRFIDAVKRVMGIKTDPDNVFYKLVKLTEDWEKTQAEDPFTKASLMDGSNAKNYAEEPADPDVDPRWTAYQALHLNGPRDLEGYIPRNVITPNQVANISDSPLMKWTLAKMSQIFRETSPRFHSYAEQLKPFMFGKEKLSRDDSIKTFKTLVDIQDPAEKPMRALAEQSNGREAYLQSKGLNGRPLEFAIKILDIMKDVHEKDIESIARLGRKMDYEPMYFPRIHGGRFLVKVLDQHGVEQYVKGFDSYREALEKEVDLRNNLQGEENLQVQRVERAERQTFGDDFTMLLLENQIPMEFMEKAMRNTEKTRETAPFAFEKNRRSTNVGGYVGEDITGKPEQERLLKALSWRLQASRNLEQKSRMLSEIKFPLFDSAALGELPNLRNMIGYMVNRELGVDISGSKTKLADIIIGKPASAMIEAAHAVKHFEDKYLRGKDVPDYRWEDPKHVNDVAREILRQWTYAVSFVKLGLNPPVLVTNFATNLLLPLFGLRSAALEGVNKGHALTALWRTLAYIGHKGEDAHDFMVQARNEGMIETKGHEHYTTAELPDRNAFDRAVQYPRDVIEEATNYASILYYYHMFKAARPDLEGEGFKTKVYTHARTFTGQYDSFAGPLMFDHMGSNGQLLTNFSKWHFNQLGILLNDMKAAGTDKNFVPIIATMATVLAAGGLYGLPVVVEYEAIRRMGMALSGVGFSKPFAWDLPPVSAIRGKAKDYVPYWNLLERGALTAGTDSIARALGAPSGPDVSGSMRYASFLDIPTVAIQTFFDLVFKQAPTLTKEMKSIFGGPGASAREIENSFNALPPAVKEGMKTAYSKWGQPGFFKEKVATPDGVKWLKKDPSNLGSMLYSLSDVEDTYNWLNMKSVREQRSIDAIFYNKYLQRQDQKDIQDLSAGIMGHVHDPKIFRQNIIQIAKLGGPEAVDSVMQQLKQHETASKMDYYTREYEKISQSGSTMSAYKEYERIKKSRRLE